MLKLLLFAPCERVIVSQEGTTSLITLMEALTLSQIDSQPAATELPDDVVIPLNWWICTLWSRETEEETGRVYEQRIELLLPNDRPSQISAINRFTITSEHDNFRNLAQIMGFPLQSEGTCQLKLYLRLADQEAEWQEMATYPIRVKRQQT